jgi:ABC-type phosphate transport system substrate-binding protein
MLKKLMITSVLFASFSSFAEISVIVNSANTDQINAKLIKRIYLGKIKAFPNGKKIKVLTLKDGTPETEVFRQSALKKSNSQFKSYWSKLAFTGKGTPPKEVNSAADMINAVKADASAIGFIDSAAVTGDVKVVAKF